MTTITIITPCLNADRLIRETVESVLTQSAIVSGRAKLEYIICDGDSSDRTCHIVNSFKSDAIRLLSRKDRGMYDALATGLRRSTGDIVAYLNAGDFYNMHAFDVVLDLFEGGRVRWLTGSMVIYNEASQITYFKLPFKYRSCFFACGMYGKYLHTVQQESTFWSSELHTLIDYERLARLKYAGDFYLWSRFASETELDIVESHLGGFKYHRGQLSENRHAYLEELIHLTHKPRFYEYALAYFDRILSIAPSKVKKYLNNAHLYRYDHQLQRWV